MELIANGRLTDLGALVFAVIVTVLVFAVVAAAQRRDNKRTQDAEDLTAANEAGY